MTHLPHLITDLGFILIIAALSTLLFKKMGQPQVLGYLIAGLLVSPHVPFFPTVTDKASIQVWSEIGVIFLLFSLGLEFSFKKLFKVGGSAGFTAFFEVVFMMAFGFLVGRILGWNNIDSLFFGAILSMSSTTIIVRAFQELGMRGQRFVELVFGILIVEDILAIFLLVLLTAVAGSAAFSGADLVMSGLRLLFYIALWFAIGIFVIPIFLRKIRHLMEDEIMLLVAIGLCFMMVMIAAGVGFSPALGAFVMGSLLAETPEGHKMEHLLQPVKNLFAAIFFVSVGMMIDPKILIERWDLILVVTLVTIVGKFISSFLGALLSGQKRKKSFQAGMSLAQIGEFSFLIASLGVALNATSDFLYPLAIAVSAVTTFTTPYLIKVSDPCYNWVEAKLPTGVKNILDRYQASFEQEGRGGVGALILKTYGLKILLNSVMVVAVIVGYRALLGTKEAQELFADAAWVADLSRFLCLLAAAPFIWGIVMGAPSLKAQREFEELQKLRGLQFGLLVGRMTLAVILLGGIISQFLTLQMASGVLVLLVVVALSLGRFWIPRLYQFIEKNFLKNLTEKERKELVGSEGVQKFLPWEASLGNFDLAADCHLVGSSLRSLSFKEKYGVTVAAVYRGSQKHPAPDGDFVLWPYDRLVCFGSEEEIQKFHRVLEQEKVLRAAAQAVAPQSQYKLDSFVVQAGSEYAGKTIRDSGVRERKQGLIVGVERASQRILGPTAGFVLSENDLVWIVSESK